MNQKQLDHLKWIYERLVKVHNEVEHTDYMTEFRRILQEKQTALIDYPREIGIVKFKDNTYDVYPDCANIPPAVTYVRKDK